MTLLFATAITNTCCCPHFRNKEMVVHKTGRARGTGGKGKSRIQTRVLGLQLQKGLCSTSSPTIMSSPSPKALMPKSPTACYSAGTWPFHLYVPITKCSSSTAFLGSFLILQHPNFTFFALPDS